MGRRALAGNEILVFCSAQILSLCFRSLLLAPEILGDTSHEEFQRYDGWYNNINHHHYGSSESSLIHVAGNAYADGIWEPGGQNRSKPGLISMNILRSTDGLEPWRNLSAFFAFFGQAVSGEIVATVAAGNIACPPELIPVNIYRPVCQSSNGVQSCSDENPEIRIMPFFRSAYDPSTGFHVNNPRRPINFVTSWIDGSFVYSHSTPWVDSLREYKGGRLLSDENGNPSKNPNRVPILNPPSPASHPTLLNPERLFLVGSQKSNQHPPLLSIGILFHRYHNWLAHRLAETHPNWKDEQLFQRARRWLIAILQSVFAYEFLPLFVGRSLPSYSGYDSGVDPSVSVEFQSAAYRFGHSLIPSGFYVRNDKCNFTAVPFCKVWWDGSDAVEKFGVEDVLRGLISQKMERGDHIFSDGVRERLFGGMRMTQGDLAATNIMRGREVGMADYNTVRKAFGLQTISQWKDINPWLFARNPEVINKASEMYNSSMNDVDLYVAGLLETTPDGPGETFQLILLDQFARLRSADRFWFENRKNELFTNEEIGWIRSVKMRDIILNVTSIRPDDLPASVFQYDPGMRCPQPAQINSATMAACPDPRTHDFFTGSRIPFVASFVFLGAFPLLVALSAFLVAWRRTRMFKVQNRFLSVRSTKRLKDTFLAYEYYSAKVEKRVQVKLGPGRSIQIMCRSATCIRTVTVDNVQRLEAWITSDEGEDPVFVLHVPKEYDLILIFSDLAYRSEFVRSFKIFVQNARVELEIVELPYAEIMSRAVTQEERQRRLKNFFHAAFNQVFRAKQKHGGTPIRSKTLTTLPRFVTSFRETEQTLTPVNHLLRTELNKNEFAQALQLTPNSIFVQQMFHLADKDRNGYISYAEFTDVLVLFSKGSLEDKMKVLFEMYDFDGSNDLDPSEFSIMIKSLLDVAKRNVAEEQVDGIVQGMLEDCGLESKERIDFHDFFGLVESHQSVLWNDVTMKSFGLTENEKAIADTGKVGAVVLNDGQNMSWYTNNYHKMVCYMENNWNKILVMAVFLLVSAFLFTEYFFLYGFFREEKGIRKTVGHSIGISRGSAHALSFSYAILFLTVSRNLMTYLRDTALGYYFPVDAAIDFHRFVGIFALFLTVLHIIGHGINFYEITTQSMPMLRCLVQEIHFDSDFMPKFHYWVFQTVPGITGVLLVIVLSIMYVFATTVARQHIYQAFWTTHRLYVIIYALTVLHGSYAMLQRPVFPLYIAGPMIIYVLDWIVSLRQKQLVLRIHHAEALPSEVLNLSFKLPRSIRFTSGQWVRLACDELSKNEFHPFTITSAPHEQVLSVHIRAVGPWTKKLYHLFSEKIASHAPFPKMLLQGPFGSIHQDWFKFEAVVLVGAGIGVTPTAAVLKDLVHKVYQQNKEIPCRAVYFIWLARTHQQFEWFVDILREVERKDIHSLIQIDIFVTQLLKDFDIRTTMLYICEHQFQRLSNRSLFTGLKAKTHFGRIDFYQYLRSVQRRNDGVSKVGVFSCGPKSVTRSADAACQKLNESGATPTFIAHNEVF